MTSKRTKVAFQLRAEGKDLEVRAVSAFGETRVETSTPTKETLDAWLAQYPDKVSYQTQHKVGAALYRSLIIGDVSSLVRQVLDEGKQQKLPVHFELRFDRDQIPLAQFPWETIFDDSGRFLVRDGVVDVTRYIAYPQPLTDLQINFSNKALLHVISQSTGITSGVASISPLLEKIETLRQATFEQLMRKLLIDNARAWLWGIQFDGLGELVSHCQTCSAENVPGSNKCQACGASLAALAFAKNGSMMEWVPISELGAILYNAQVQLALLLACEIYRRENLVMFSGLAPELVLAGMPAIVGVQYPISETFTQNFVSTFYASLLQSGNLLDALRAARQMNLRDTWYSPVLYLRHQPTPTLTRIQPTYHTRSVDTAVPAQVNPNTAFWVKLWIRRPQTKPATKQQIKRELDIPEDIPLSGKEDHVDVKFAPIPQVQPVEQRNLRRGEVTVQLIAMGGEVEPDQITLFIDEDQDAPPAFFKVTARRMGAMPLEFSLWQDGGKINSLSHVIEVVSQQIDGYSWKEGHVPVPVDDEIDDEGIIVSSEAEELYKLCLIYFSLEEIRELCFELRVDYDSLTGEGKPAKIRELILYLYRRDRLYEFVEVVRRKRPQLNWPSIEERFNCPNCRKGVTKDAKFCGYCGHAIDSDTPGLPKAIAKITCVFCGKEIRPEAKFCMYCGVPQPAPQQQAFPPHSPSWGYTPLPPNSIILADRYELLGTIGQGGMGHIYKGLDRRTNQLCVIKQIFLGANDIEDTRFMFERKAQLLLSLKHPYLVSCVDYVELPDRLILVTEYIEGETLQEKLTRSRTPFAENQVVSWALQLCDVLDYLHNHTPPIIHRNINLENILIDRYGQIKLVGFGIARTFKPGKRRDTGPMGTVGYAPPEQYGNAQTDARSDIYSLGVTLFTLFTGQDPASYIFNLPPVRQHNPLVSPSIEKVIIKTTRIEPELRFQTARELRGALQTPMTYANLPAAPCVLMPEADSHNKPSPSRHVSLSWIWFIIALVILAILLWEGWNLFQ